MEFRKNTILLLSAGVLALPGFMGGCSSAPIKVECREVQARIDYGDLSGDQLRFAQQELEDCRNRVDSAERKDSAFIEGTEQRFTPSDSQ
ncbi:MAG: hypothetical protein JWP91_4612 [Fibrobacteres bacterium]|nr:hypothetical protein [Fibrobacterota bacterium]